MAAADHGRSDGTERSGLVRRDGLSAAHAGLRDCPAGYAIASAAAEVRTRGPSSVMATVCSKCAESLPSIVTTVHLSLSVFVSGLPSVIIGSMAMVIPTRSCGPRLGEP